jgi:hypothetical protein
MEPNKLKYCRDTTESHSISQKYRSCLQPLAVHFKKEGAAASDCENFHEDHIVLNLDKVEGMMHPQKKNSTCDFMFGVSRDGQNKKIVFVECKLNVRTLQTFDQGFKSSVLTKINYSRSLTGSEISFYDEYIVVIKYALFQQAKHRLFQLFQGNKMKVKISHIPLFYDVFFKQ